MPAVCHIKIHPRRTCADECKKVVLSYFISQISLVSNSSLKQW